MNVHVMSRAEAIAYCHKPHAAPAVMISISDPYMVYSSKPFCSRENRLRTILPLCFSDADRPGNAVAGSGAEAHICNVTETDLMTDKDAIKIKHFVERHSDKTIIVHCDAGISRSSGVAAAILKYLIGDDSQIFDNPKYYPNMLCYRKTLNALMDDN